MACCWYVGDMEVRSKLIITVVYLLTWVLAVAACELVGGRGHHFMIVGAIKLTDLLPALSDNASATKNASSSVFGLLELSDLAGGAVAVARLSEFAAP